MSKGLIDKMVAKARVAQKAFETLPDEVNLACLQAMAKCVFDGAEKWARMAVDETGMGVYEHKVLKKQGKSRILWDSVRHVKAYGVLRHDEVNGIIEIAKPAGVVCAVTPCTNPVVTPLCNAMFALKTRNAIIIAPHPRGKKCAAQLVKEWNEKLAKLGAPENLIQVVTEPSTETGGYLMSRADVVVATGGMGMVKAAYSSGKPSYGVGAGNVQCIIDRNVDLAVAAGKMIEGRIFDNGIICSGEQTVIAHEDDYAAVIAEMQKKGALYVDDPAALQRLRSVLWDEKGVFSRYAVGQSVQKIGEMAKLPVTPEHVVIVAKADGAGTGDLLCKEKMCPVMAAFSYKTFEEAVDIAQANLNIEGAGHSAAIHSHNDAHILYAGERLTVSRFLVNQISSKMVGGSFFNGLAPTTTLGCGTWGNNSVSENVTFKHLMNTTRISYCLTGRKVPTDAELWGKIQ